MFGYSFQIMIKRRRGLHSIQPMGCMQSTGDHGIGRWQLGYNIFLKNIIVWKLKIKWWHQQWIFKQYKLMSIHMCQRDAWDMSNKRQLSPLLFPGTQHPFNMHLPNKISCLPNREVISLIQFARWLGRALAFSFNGTCFCFCITSN
jgi:hypothetical protein